MASEDSSCPFKNQVPCMWNLKYDTNKLTKQKQTHRLGKQTYGYQREKLAAGGGIN